MMASRPFAMAISIFALALLTTRAAGTESTTDEAAFEEIIAVHAANPISPAPITSQFVANMKRVHKIGQEVGHPETLQAILLQETNGGRSTSMIGNKKSPIGKRSYGLMQVQLVAAKSILKRNPSVFELYFPDRKYDHIMDEELIALLLTNDDANVRIAAHHFKLYLKLCHGDWHKAVAAYNAGIGGVNNIAVPAEFEYVVRVKAKMQTDVRTFNRKHGLQLPPQT